MHLNHGFCKTLTSLQKISLINQNKTNPLHSITSAIKPTTCTFKSTRHVRFHVNVSFCMRSGLWSVAAKWLKVFNLVVSGIYKHDRSRICGLSPVMMCVCLTMLVLNSFQLVLFFLPPLSFLWRNNEQHTRGYTRKNSSPIHTCTVAHPHALFYNTRWEKGGERETSLTECTAVCAARQGDALCSKRRRYIYQCNCLAISTDKVTVINFFFVTST